MNARIGKIAPVLFPAMLAACAPSPEEVAARRVTIAAEQLGCTLTQVELDPEGTILPFRAEVAATLNCERELTTDEVMSTGVMDIDTLEEGVASTSEGDCSVVSGARAYGKSVSISFTVDCPY